MCKNRILISSILSIAMVTFILTYSYVSVYAASFDCGKASTQLEHLLCDDPDLSNIDIRLGKVYSDIRRNMWQEQRDLLRKEQLSWLRERNKCSLEKNCLITVYDERIKVLLGQHSSDIQIQTELFVKELQDLIDLDTDNKTKITGINKMLLKYPKADPMLIDVLSEFVQLLIETEQLPSDSFLLAKSAARGALAGMEYSESFFGALIGIGLSSYQSYQEGVEIDKKRQNLIHKLELLDLKFNKLDIHLENTYGLY